MAHQHRSRGDRRAAGVLLLCWLVTTACTQAPPPEARPVTMPVDPARFVDPAQFKRPPDAGRPILTARPVAIIDPAGADVGLPPAGLATRPGDLRAGTCPPGLAIGVAGPMTAEPSLFGVSATNGARLAVDEFTAANPGCQVAVDSFDSGNDPGATRAVAPDIVADASLVALLFQWKPDQINALGDLTAHARLPVLTSADATSSLTAHGWTHFFRGMPTEAQIGGATAAYITDRFPGARVCVVVQDVRDITGTAEALTETLGPAVDDSCSGTVGEVIEFYDDAVAAVTAAQPDVVYFAGWSEQTAAFVSALRRARVAAAIVGWEDAVCMCFVEAAGLTAKGLISLRPYVTPSEDFADRYAAAFGDEPDPVLAAGTYDLATIVLAGIAAGATDRASMIDFLAGYSGFGESRYYAWDETGELLRPEIWVHELR